VDHVRRLLTGADPSRAGQVRVDRASAQARRKIEAAVGALIGPLAALNEQDLSTLRDMLIAAALAPLGGE
jgi:hypothetical protein